ncbi:MAG: hypothetical protein O2930_01255 [Acidobacteria bacterium]|nr:hypothetical protein [Acidobacteriota bacterium]
MTARPVDTAPDIAERIRQRLLARPGCDRVAMATRMFQTAKTLVWSRVRASGITDETDARLAVLAQLYGDDLTPAQYDALRSRLDVRRGLQ